MDAPATVSGVPLRVGLLSAHLTRSGGGVFTSVRDFASALTAGGDLTVDVFGPGNPSADYSEWNPIVPKVSPITGPRFFSYAPALLANLTRASLDLLHLHGLWMHPSAASLAFTRKTGKPHIVSPHGMLDPWALQNSGWKKRLAASAFERANIHEAACLHALNTAEATAIRDYGYTGPIAIIPNGVHIPSPSRDRQPAEPTALSTPKTLLYLGRLHPKKGLPNLISAWSRLAAPHHSEWRLVIAGWDEAGHEQTLRRLATSLGVADSITFPGPLFGAEKTAAFQQCDGFILPSLSEGLPVAILEAWAFGKPVLMTPQCNLPEGFQSSAAIAIDPTEQSIAAALPAFLAMNADCRNAIGANGRALVRSKFSWPVIAAEMARVYHWLAAAGPRPASIHTT